MAVLELAQAAPLLQQEYREGRLIPFLGAGFSKPLNLPDWSELIAAMAEPLGFEPELFMKHGSAEQLAEFFAVAHPNNFERLVYGMARKFNSEEAAQLRKDSPTHKALASLDRFHTIYTTNFDWHIECALKEAGRKVAVLASFVDFQDEKEAGACDVIKFHGTLEMRNTIVLTESSFFERMALEDAADQRLRADLLSHSFLFIGYSFSDLNIRYIWYRMHQLRQRSQARSRVPLKPRKCYFATHGAGLVQPMLLEQWNIDVIQLDPEDKTASVAELLKCIGG
ncbi:SIR2 family protein [Pyxidicoccus parkwayensis]|uniref:SIR2 family protein n=1 Tax=Pyxidicoccus parkwayensis TaxID=2813578 RepID=A0ABX7NLF2_9BACT|nr:SIR2 family protein [Pyxidicoccus parkwaysis]QSQ19691.1 SIR2 family protein [Pyxidicoccus parkwaysis]